MIERTSRKEEPGVTIQFMGEEFIIKGQETSPEYINALVRSLEDRLSGLAARYPQVSKRKLVVFLAFSLADDLIKLRQRNQELLQMVADKSSRGGIL
ncbi:MAG: cell division protein ZapA [Bacillota bacterium]